MSKTSQPSQLRLLGWMDWWLKGTSPRVGQLLLRRACYSLLYSHWPFQHKQCQGSISMSKSLSVALPTKLVISRNKPPKTGRRNSNHGHTASRAFAQGGRQSTLWLWYSRLKAQSTTMNSSTTRLGGKKYTASWGTPEPLTAGASGILLQESDPNHLGMLKQSATRWLRPSISMSPCHKWI